VYRFYLISIIILPMTSDRLETVGVKKIYGDRTVVRGVSVAVRTGEVVGLLGPNGAGKTTTFYMFVGLVAPEEGQVLYNGHDITNEPMYIRARNGIAYLPQEPSVFRKLSVKDNIFAILETMDFTSEIERKRRLDELIEGLGLNAVSSSLASALSGGERRRVEIARALARNPRFILLDEPFAGIDPIAVGDIQGLIAALKNHGIGILITDHNVRETLQICDRAYILVDGKVLEEGDPISISNSEKAKRYYLGDNFSF
jgi:lipopolysaccharide export system ATP-binding protein